MADKLTILEFDALTGEQTIRELTVDEIAERQAMQAADEAQAKAKEDARNATIAKLAKLGLTPEDLAAL